MGIPLSPKFSEGALHDYRRRFARVASTVHYNTVRIGDVDVFYREAGSKTAPVLLLLHGFPTSSNMFRNLIPRLAGSFRVIAPDYPGYGFSGMPMRQIGRRQSEKCLTWFQSKHIRRWSA